jgi:hypothetical protein
MRTAAVVLLTFAYGPQDPPVSRSNGRPKDLDMIAGFEALLDERTQSETASWRGVRR